MKEDIFFVGSYDTDKYRHQIDVWYRAHNIHREKIELFYDFLSSLYDLIDNTFLGVDVIYTDIDQKNHFNWCWNKLIKDFHKEKIFFKENGVHHDYLWNFYREAYYISKIEENIPRINEYFFKLFDFKHKKTRSELDILSEIYKLLDQNFIK
jgi:hypothetical protein